MLDQSSNDATQDSNKHSLIWWWMFMSSTLQASVLMRKNYSEILHFIKNTGNNLTMKHMFDISEKLSDNQMRFVQWIQKTGKILHGKHLSLVMKKSSVSSTQRSTCSQFCIVSWKDGREPTVKFCLGRKGDVVLKFTTIQSIGQNWWWANGIRVEHLPRIHHIAAQPQSPRVPV